MAEESKGKDTAGGKEQKHFYVSDKRELYAEHRLLEVIYGTYAPRLAVKISFFEELDNGGEWKDVKLYSASSLTRNLDELAIVDRKYLFGIGVDPRTFPALWEKDLGAVVDELVPFLSKDKTEKEV